MTTDQLASAVIKPISMAKIKKRFPNEWVLIGNPVMDKDFLNVLSGVPLLHSKDKKEVVYLGREKTADYQTFTLVFTGTEKPVRKPVRKIVSLYSPRKK
ncbi:MAG: hypothetical protein IT259_08815 [Saprospiraceae bacterium]|nr:hypothetical protein [Saprospiraceae bacterium]